MLVSVRSNKATTQVKREYLCLVIFGIVLAAFLVLFSIIFVIYQGIWYHEVRQKARIHEPLSNYDAFMECVSEETGIRLNSTQSEESIQAAMEKTDEAFANLKNSIEKNSVSFKPVQAAFDTYRAREKIGELLTASLDVTEASAAIMLAMIRTTLPSRSKATVDTLVLHAAESYYGSVVSRLVFINFAYLPNTALASSDGMGLSLALAMANASLAISELPKSWEKIYNVMIKEASTMVEHTSGFQINPDEMVPFSKFFEIDGLLSYLKADVLLDEIVSNKEAIQLGVMCVGIFFALVALMLVIMVVIKHRNKTKMNRELVLTLEDDKKRLALREQYMPLFQDLRAVSLPPKSSSEVEREYLVAGRFVDAMRVAVPQLLHGRLDEENRRQLLQPSGWSLLTEKVRLQCGTLYARHQVITMEIILRMQNNAQYENPTPEDLPRHLVQLSVAYHIIVREVNKAGGVVIGFRTGLNIVVAWNIVYKNQEAALAAVQTAWIVRHRILQEVDGVEHVCVNIVTGPSVLSNASIGSRKFAMMVSSKLPNLARLHVISDILMVPLLIDRDTLHALPPSTRQSCKPLVVLKNITPGAPSLVVYAADLGSAMTRDQALLYNSGFVLYQNNMMTEALAEFARYMNLFPDDYMAYWLVEYILRPKHLLMSRKRK